MSGTTRSMPNISSSGNISPQSMTTMSSPYSNTNMFLPISPTPPSGMIRRGRDVSEDGCIGSLEERELVVVGGVARGRREGTHRHARPGGVDRRNHARHGDIGWRDDGETVR